MNIKEKKMPMKFNKYWKCFFVAGWLSVFIIPAVIAWMKKYATFVTEDTFPMLCGILLILLVTVPFVILAFVEDDKQMAKEADGIAKENEGTGGTADTKD